jgi:hypothetical protein
VFNIYSNAGKKTVWPPPKEVPPDLYCAYTQNGLVAINQWYFAGKNVRVATISTTFYKQKSSKPHMFVKYPIHVFDQPRLIAFCVT